MNLQHLRHFVAIAEEKHFGRAALKLNIAQPPLSQSLARLETSLGFRLFDRTRRSVALTPAGEAFLRDVQPALARLDRGVRMARRAEEGILTQVKVGFVSSAVNDVVPRALLALQTIAPDREVQLREMLSSDQVDQVLDGRLDVALFFAKVKNDPDVKMRVVGRYRQVAALPADSPLAMKDTLEIEDFNGISFITPPLEYRSEVHTILESECRKRGFAIRSSQEIMRSQTALNLVSMGVGVSLSTDAAARRGYPGVVFRPIQGLPVRYADEISMGWLPDPSRPRHNAMLEGLADALTLALNEAQDAEIP